MVERKVRLYICLFIVSLLCLTCLVLTACDNYLFLVASNNNLCYIDIIIDGGNRNKLIKGFLDEKSGKVFVPIKDYLQSCTDISKELPRMNYANSSDDLLASMVIDNILFVPISQISSFMGFNTYQKGSNIVIQVNKMKHNRQLNSKDWHIKVQYIARMSYSPSNKWESIVTEALQEYKKQNRNFAPNVQNYSLSGDYLNYSKTKKWGPRSNVVYDEKGIPKVKYGNDYHYNPVTIAQFALTQYGKYLNGEKDCKGQFLEAVDQLLLLQDELGAFRYNFSWRYYLSGETYKPGWASGMAQGQALSVLARAYLISQDPKYLKSGEKAIDFLITPVEKGGVMATLGDLHPFLENNVIFEEYISNPSSYTLNGFMFTLLGLYDWSQLRDASPSYSNIAEKYFNEGLQTLCFILPFYDLGGFTAYDLGHITYDKEPHVGVGYHAVHIYLLKALYSITGDPLLDYFAELWAGYVR